MKIARGFRNKNAAAQNGAAALFYRTHFQTQNRFALLLEMVCFHALSYAKPLRTFAGNAFSPTHFRTQNRFALLLEML
ncbi:hypothetical protein AVM02_00995 [Brucella anthropi]|uniref:hypothetical protein n=1 Tax=Brucella anthropi TaxID=529 RepID=UPI003987078E